jgi:tetratricopeptide (TPR) repeat protein
MSNLTNKYKKDTILFLEAGFIAVNQADEDSALKLFKAAKLLDPNNSLSQLGLGYLHLHKLELKESIRNFEEVLKKEPDNEMAKAFLGIAMSMSPSNTAQGEKILKETKKSEDKSIKTLSNTALDFVDKFVKKEPTPVEGKGKKK